MSARQNKPGDAYPMRQVLFSDEILTRVRFYRNGKKYGGVKHFPADATDRQIKAAIKHMSQEQGVILQYQVNRDRLSRQELEAWVSSEDPGPDSVATPTQWVTVTPGKADI